MKKFKISIFTLLTIIGCSNNNDSLILSKICSDLGATNGHIEYIRKADSKNGNESSILITLENIDSSQFYNLDIPASYAAQYFYDSISSSLDNYKSIDVELTFDNNTKRFEYHLGKLSLVSKLDSIIEIYMNSLFEDISSIRHIVSEQYIPDSALINMQKVYFKNKEESGDFSFEEKVGFQFNETTESNPVYAAWVPSYFGEKKNGFTIYIDMDTFKIIFIGIH